MKKQMLCAMLLIALGAMGISCSSTIQGTNNVNDASVSTSQGNEQEKKDAVTLLAEGLGSHAQGKAFMASGVETIQGEYCESFSVGTHTPERFVREAQYALCPKAGIFVLDIIDAQWKPYSK